VDKELTAMLSAFQNFSDQKERLETQKMVLVNQVGARWRHGACVHVRVRV
jgi:hypothetical protein